MAQFADQEVIKRNKAEEMAVQNAVNVERL